MDDGDTREPIKKTITRSIVYAMNKRRTTTLPINHRRRNEMPQEGEQQERVSTNVDGKTFPIEIV